MVRILLFCCALLGFSLCYGQKQPAGAHRSLLWKVSGKDLKNPSYLFGTLHIICPADYVWTPAMASALAASDKVAFEMDMDDPGLQTQLMQGMMLNDGKQLKDFYSAADYEKLKELAGRQGIPLQAMQQFTPFALVSFLYLKAIDCAMPDSYEGHIMKDAQEQDKEVLGLETAAEQLAVIHTMSPDSVAQSVLKIAGDLDSFKNMFGTMLALYKQQDLPALYELIIQSPDYKDDLNALLYERNRKWVPVIVQLSRRQPTFIAVGAGHLWGDQGVIALLRAGGYKVEPVH